MQFRVVETEPFRPKAGDIAGDHGHAAPGKQCPVSLRLGSHGVGFERQPSEKPPFGGGSPYDTEPPENENQIPS